MTDDALGDDTLGMDRFGRRSPTRRRRRRFRAAVAVAMAVVLVGLAGCNLTDTDGDGVSDESEISKGWDPHNADENGDGILDGVQDVDGDGISDWVEAVIGTDPARADTDGDGYRDAVELLEGSDPLDHASIPEGVEPNRAPVATGDAATWTLADQAGNALFASQQTTIDVLANDSDPDGDHLVASGGGTWSLDGDAQPAGTFSVAPDGTMTIDSGTDAFGPVQELRPGHSWPATLTYDVSDGVDTTTATVSLTVVGGQDQIVHLGTFSGPDGLPIDFNDPTPTVFDGRGCFANPEGYGIQLFWEAVSTSTLIPPDPAFISSMDVEWVIALNSGWGFGSSSTVRLTAVPISPQWALSDSINFYVGDAFDEESHSTGTLDAVPPCTVHSGRPYTPKVELPSLDLRTVTGDTATFEGNVLTGAIDAQGRTLTAGGQGIIGEPTAPYGTYRIAADGTVTVTLDPDHPLADGQEFRGNVPYRAVSPDGVIGVGELVIGLIGRG